MSNKISDTKPLKGGRVYVGYEYSPSQWGKHGHIAHTVRVRAMTVGAQQAFSS